MGNQQVIVIVGLLLASGGGLHTASHKRPKSDNCKMVLAILNAEGHGPPDSRFPTFKVGEAAAECVEDRDCGKLIPFTPLVFDADAGTVEELLAAREECADAEFRLAGTSNRCVDYVRVVLSRTDGGYSFRATLEPGCGGIYLCGPGPGGWVTRLDGGWKIVVGSDPW